MPETSRSPLDQALAAWRASLGPAHVSCEAAELARAGTATFPTTATVAAVIRPADRAEVQQAVRIALEFGIPLYPVSSGKNWGYGSKAPSGDAVLLDLGRMNRILDFDEALAYVTVEPGVTQGQLFAFLKERQLRLWMDATGSSPECSIVGNTLERGFRHTPMGDHAANVCGLEVVLANGECIETGFSRFPNSRIGALSRWGVGPSLDGLFSQSNFGIVTRMTVWLMPAPDYFQAFFFQCDEEDGISTVVEALRPLRLDGTLRSVVHVGNDYKVLSGTGQYPWRQANEQTPLDRTRLDQLRAEVGIGRWCGSGGLYGTRRQVAEARRLVRRALRGKVSRLQVVDDRLLGWLPALAAPYRWITGHDLRRTLALLGPVYDLLKGVPTSSAIGSVYWRKRSEVPVPSPIWIATAAACCG